MASSISRLLGTIFRSIEVRLEKLKLKLISGLAKILSAILSFSVAVFLILFFTLFVSLATAFLLNDLIDSLYWGFFIVAGFYLILIIIVVILARTRTIQRWFEDLIVTFAEQEDEEDH